MKHFYELSELEKERQQTRRPYLEFLKIPVMSAGLYCLKAGATDPQKPHDEDEFYYVIRGRAQMRIEQEHQQVTSGSIIFVEAKAKHHFYDIEEDLEVLVFFAPAES